MTDCTECKYCEWDYEDYYNYAGKYWFPTGCKKGLQESDDCEEFVEISAENEMKEGE